MGKLQFNFSMCPKTLEYLQAAIEAGDNTSEMKKHLDTALGHELRCRLSRKDGQSTEVNTVISHISVVFTALDQADGKPVGVVAVGTVKLWDRRN